MSHEQRFESDGKFITLNNPNIKINNEKNHARRLIAKYADLNWTLLYVSIGEITFV
jgi:hypothetical protein